MPKNTTIGIGQKSQYSISYISKVQTFFEKLLLDFLLLPTIAMENSIHFFGAFRKGNVTQLTRCDILVAQLFVTFQFITKARTTVVTVYIHSTKWVCNIPTQILLLMITYNRFYYHYYLYDTFSRVPPMGPSIYDVRWQGGGGFSRI